MNMFQHGSRIITAHVSVVTTRIISYVQREIAHAHAEKRNPLLTKKNTE